MTSKRRENINLVSFICLSFLVISFSKQLLIKQSCCHKTLCRYVLFDVLHLSPQLQKLKSYTM